MKFRIFFIVFLMLFQNEINADDWEDDPWTEAYQSVDFERQHAYMIISTMTQSVVTEISSRITVIVWKLSLIKNQAEYIKNGCALQTLIALDEYDGKPEQLNNCVDHNVIHQFRETQMTHFTDLMHKIDGARDRCKHGLQWNPCIERTTAEIHARLAEIHDDTEKGLERMRADNMKCIETMSATISNEITRLEERWNSC